MSAQSRRLAAAAIGTSARSMRYDAIVNARCGVELIAALGQNRPARGDQDGCATRRCLVENKALGPGLLKRLGIGISRFGKCGEVEEHAGIGRK